MSTIALVTMLVASAQSAHASDATVTWNQVTGQSAFASTTLYGVSCPSTRRCFAVGYNTSSQTPAILEDSGGTWSSQSAPAPNNEAFGVLESVSCTSASECIAVGYYTVEEYSGFDIYETLIEAWDGSSWSIVYSPNQGDTYNFLRSVSCSSGTNGNPDQCTAVGNWESTSGSDTGEHTFVVQGTYTNGSWGFNSVSSPNPGATNDELTAVRCPTYTSCIAVGHAETYYRSSGNFSGSLALQGTESNGAWSWSTLSTDTTGGTLAGLDCTSATSCMAVGSQGYPSQSLVETWNGSGGFTVVPSPNPGGFGTSLNGLSCVSASNCSAVGSTTDSNSSPTVPLVLQWDGSNWWQVTAPSSGSSNASLQAVTCDPPSNTCVGAGYDSGSALVDTGAGYVFSPAPAVTSVSPAAGPTAGGTQVTITGTGFTSDATVAFGGNSATNPVVNSPTSITATAPPGDAGSVDVTVTTADGTSAKSNRDQYTYAATPTVTGVSPSSGPAAGGDQVTITGTGFIKGATVSFGSNPATDAVVNSPTSITATSPAGDPGTVDVIVNTPGGTSAKSNGDQYTYAGTPTVTSVSPASGPTGGGTQVTITGTGFTSDATVAFGGNSAADTVVNSLTSITATSPPGDPGPVDVTVSTASGTSSPNSGDQYTYVPPTLTVTRTGSGAGTVSDGTGAIDCPSTCSHGYPDGTIVTLTATPASGSTFTGWSGGGCAGTGTCQVTMNADTAVSAAFNSVPSPPAGPTGSNPSAPSGPSSTTSTSKPTVGTSVPNATGTTTAALAGVVNPNGLPTTAQFQYGLDQSYRPPGFKGSVFDHSTPAQNAGSGSSSATVSATVGQLVPNAVYDVRLVASNSQGTSTGSVQTFKTAQDGGPPPPVLGKSEDARPVSGIVFVVQGGVLVPLTEGRRLPSGTVFDARFGSLLLTTSAGAKGKTYTGTFGGAVFRVTQLVSGPNRGLTTLALIDGIFGVPSYASCKAHGAADTAYAHVALSSRVLQTLRASARGRFRTRGRYAAGTVRGTKWTTSDRCDGTLVAVQLHSVLVSDFVKRITVLVSAGHSYLARSK